MMSVLCVVLKLCLDVMLSGSVIVCVLFGLSLCVCV